MCITEEKLVDRYGQGNPHERFMLIYKNYEEYPSGQCSRKHRKKQGDKMPQESPPERRKT